MKILAIDTAGDFLCLGLYDNGKVYEYSLETKTRLSELLDVSIKRVMEALGWKMRDIDYFACGLGPGSFTGIRVGMAAIKGLSWALNKPVVGVSSLDILAKNCDSQKAKIVPIIDARRGLIYCAVYRAKAGRLKKTGPYMLISEKELYQKVKSNAVFLGSAAAIYKEGILKNVRGARVLDRDYWRLFPHNLITLALDQIRQKKIKNTFNIQPLYLYPKECQIK